MLDGAVFDKLECLARRLAGSEAPFGGIQLVLCGDFFQLPPVARHGERCTFLFEAQCWARVVGTTVVLRQVFRQSDGAFVELLNEMRLGQLSPFNVAKLLHRMETTRAEATVAAEATRVEATRVEAARAEAMVAEAAHVEAMAAEATSGVAVEVSEEAAEGAAAPTTEQMAAQTADGEGGLSAPADPASLIASFAWQGASVATAEGSVGDRAPGLKLFPQNEPADRENEKRLAEIPSAAFEYVADESGGKMDGCLAPLQLRLKVGAQVILLKNLDAASKLVNGTRGAVVGFLPATAHPDVRVAPPAPKVLSAAEADAVAAAAPARPPTKLSTGGSAAQSGQFGQFGPEADSTASEEAPTGLYPLVRFANGAERLVMPEEWTVEQGGRVTARRVQVPLKLAWALSCAPLRPRTLRATRPRLLHAMRPRLLHAC